MLKIHKAVMNTYPSGWLRAVLNSDAVTPPTRAVLQARLDQKPAPPQFFNDAEIKLLGAICARLLAHPEMGIAAAAAIDDRLAQGKGKGWRYDVLPPDCQAFGQGLAGFNQSAQMLFNSDFAALDAAQQDEIINLVQSGAAPGTIWQQLPAARWFEELLAEATEIFYAHPTAIEEIGCAAFADAPGWKKIGLNEREAREPDEGSGVEGLAKAASFQHTASTLELSPAKPRTLNPEPDAVDAVVIGTGAGGAPLLARLAHAGLSVVALEAGQQWNPATDFATDEKAQAKLFWTDERLSAGDDPLHFGNNNSGIGVGGSTLHYTAYTPRPQPDDFRLRSEFGVGCDWPLAYEDLEPYFDELEQFLGVSGPSPYPWGPRRKCPYTLPSLPLNGAAQLMQRGCHKLGIQTSPAANAALSAPYFQRGIGWRNACTNRGFCQTGCSTGAKSSMDVTFLPLATQHGAEIRPECFVTQIETDPAGRVTGVVYIRDGKEERQKCKHLFLCAGAIETPRLLLLCNLGNASGQVGRNFMAHTGVQLWGQFEDEVRPYKGIPGGLISEATHRPPNADFAGGYLLQSIGVMPVTYASQLARGPKLWGKALREHMKNYNHVAGINILGECLPSPRNFMELSDEKDARGLAKPRIYFSNGSNEKQLTAHADKLMRQIWDAAGAREVWSFQRNAHIIGTCRMGHDAATNVVNADGRSFETPNLYICDNSVFPSALSVNPALMIMALSLRTADQFLANHK